MAIATCLALVLIWMLAANVPLLVADRRRRAAGYALVLLGVPILGYVTWQVGPVWGLILLGLGAAMLRWPPLTLGRALLHPGQGRGNKGLSDPAE
ncbi:DUF2484 family protein [Frigidibacter albus]|uniref:DUF2484 family protein n=1 Tax=Frigidibacter albus TaxID=1465486 RepID=A0A6L8VI20_9RHOB|nr:DUF2484 family protein [Frigidibacter albus]MZQ88979.1 DUF2484 family protein [Frigidibacter albus]NBE30964.1 DUF2484 family protein [Frigidibacter albus]GGH52107.1 hypothetical protein GCM10011341_16300 [Frigidibacter albus]